MSTLHLSQALLSDGWADDVRISITPSGYIARIETGVPGAANGCLLPGMANLHSHAHQRAMAGLAERSGSSQDSFWTWRQVMYQFLQAIQPEHLHAIASQLYMEMLKAGYTHVAEFQYLHHQPDGQPYDNPAEMSLQTLNAASEVGIGITNLPVHYQFSGFGCQALTAQQQRFANDPDLFLRIREAIQVQANSVTDTDNTVVTGMAAHSLRAVNKQGFNTILESLPRQERIPIHIHIAEQTKEVEDCIAWSGLRPVEYLLENFPVDQRWCLIHATHMTDLETQRLAQSQAVVGVCPTTEANLGDGFFNAAEYLKRKGHWGIGSDSHVSISPTEELRWLEYGQRLLHRSRNVLAGAYERSTGRHLFCGALQGGAQACAYPGGVIEVGARADFMVLDTEHALLFERSGDDLLDSWIFSGNQNTVRDVYVAGKAVIKDGQHANEAAITRKFKSTLKHLRN